MKNMFKLFGLAVVFALTGFAFTNPVTVEEYKVDAEKSTIEWQGYKVTGKHNGTINIKSGALEFSGEHLSGGSFVIDMTSLTVGDLQGGMKDKLEGHLKSPDFFGVEKYPEATLGITKVVHRGTPGDYTVRGNLKIKEAENEIKFMVHVEKGDDGITATAEKITIDRSEYDVRYGSGSFFQNLGDKTIYDEFDLKVSLVAGK